MAEPSSTKTDADRKAERRSKENARRRTEAGRAIRRLEKKRRKERHPEAIKREWKAHRERHRQKRVAYMREYNRKHGERLRLMMRENAKAKYPQRAAYQLKWRAANPDWEKQHRLKNLDRYRAISVKKTGLRRALKKHAAIGTDRKACLARIRELKSPEWLPCHWCGVLTSKDRRHVDHIIPLNKKGPHCAENLCCACPRCNSQKKDKLPHEFTPH